MRLLFSILIGIIAGVLVFMGMNWLIDFIVSGASGDLRVILKVICWLVFGVLTLWAAIVIGIFSGTVFDLFVGDLNNKRKWKQKRKSLRN